MDRLLQSLQNPLNVALLLVCGYLLYQKVKPEPTIVPPKHPKVVELKRFTPKTLQRYNGTDQKEIYLSISGKVYDVSAKPEFYGPGSMYSNFAGRDASRGMAKNSFDVEMLTPLDKPMDLLLDLTAEEKQSLVEWGQFFESKYMCIGTLENPSE
jgi:membrane-associated progesterone receptor component